MTQGSLLKQYTLDEPTFSRRRGTRTWTTEASQLGWSPGEWPAQFELVSKRGRVWATVRRLGGVKRGGEILYVDYVPADWKPGDDTVTLRVFND